MFKKVIQVSAVLSVFLVGLSLVMAQDEMSKTQKAQGELVSVDTTAGILVIKTAEGEKLEFQYNDQTEISGAQDEVAGLATSQGSTVEVEYTTEDGKNMAVHVSVSPRAG